MKRSNLALIGLTFGGLVSVLFLIAVVTGAWIVGDSNLGTGVKIVTWMSAAVVFRTAWRDMAMAIREYRQISPHY